MAINYSNKATILFLIDTGLLPSEARGMEKIWCQILDKCRMEAVDNDKFRVYKSPFSASSREPPWIPNEQTTPSDIWSVYWHFACIYMDEVEKQKENGARN